MSSFCPITVSICLFVTFLKSTSASFREDADLLNPRFGKISKTETFSLWYLISMTSTYEQCMMVDSSLFKIHWSLWTDPMTLSAARGWKKLKLLKIRYYNFSLSTTVISENLFIRVIVLAVYKGSGLPYNINKMHSCLRSLQMFFEKRKNTPP